MKQLIIGALVLGFGFWFYTKDDVLGLLYIIIIALVLIFAQISEGK